MKRFVVACGAVLAALPSSAAAQGITEYPLPAAADPVFITTGHDGRLWFTNNGAAQVGRIGTNGVLQPPVATAANPIDVIAGPGGAMFWTTPTHVQRRASAGYAAKTAIGNPPTAYAIAATADRIVITRIHNFYPELYTAIATYLPGLGPMANQSTSGVAPATLTSPRLTDVTLGPDNKGCG